MRKKLIRLITIGLFVTLLAGCSDSKSDSQVEENEVVNCANMVRAESFAGGDGSAESPFIISNAKEFARLADIGDNMVTDEELGMSSDARREARSAYYVLSNDIEMNDTSDYKSWEDKAPENIWKPVSQFKGSFDGNGYRVYGLYVMEYKDSHTNLENAGLFGDISEANISNVVVDYAFVESNHNSGVLVCDGMSSNITNCMVTNAKIESGYHSGLIMGTGSECTIENCETNGTIVAHELSSGGIVGSASNSVISNCISHVSIRAVEEDNIATGGGIVGKMFEHEKLELSFTDDEEAQDPLIENCSFDGEIINLNESSGGICGDLCGGENTRIISCENNSRISANGYLAEVGGICGSISSFNPDGDINPSITIEQCNNNGTFDFKAMIPYAGGVFGYSVMTDGKISLVDCSNTSDISNADCVGGLVGSAAVLGEGILEFRNLNNYGNISGDSVGGIGSNVTCESWQDAANAFLTLKSCHNMGELKAEQKVGGIFCSFMPGISEDTPVGSYEIDDCSTTGNYPYFGTTDSIEALFKKFLEAAEKEYGTEAVKEWAKTSFPDVEYTAK